MAPVLTADDRQIRRPQAINVASSPCDSVAGYVSSCRARQIVPGHFGLAVPIAGSDPSR